ncbi:MAG TPA: hypothetical protein VL171_00925 [Verrucomicrobiae bacterium]|nr:hypothetical protein [Verrucomicrobiae bacterium]
MADEKPEQERPAEEAKKDTVRINLPPGLTGRGTGPAGPTAPPGAKIVPPKPAASPEEEAKKETAVLGRPAEAPKPKQDTSRVQVVAAKPSPTPGQRPTVKLRRDEPSPAPAPVAAAPAAARPVATAPGSAADLGLSVVAMILSLLVVGYLAWLAFG